MNQTNEQMKKLLKPYTCPHFRMIDLAGLYYCDGGNNVGGGNLTPASLGAYTPGDESDDMAPGSRNSIWDDDEVVLSKDSPF